MKTDLEIMQNPDSWNMFPYLPLKRHLKDEVAPETGLLWMYRLKPPIPVFTAFVYKLPPTKEEFLATKKWEYNSLEDLINDGWIID